MGVRVAIDDHRRITLAVVAVVIGIACYLIYRQTYAGKLENRPITKVYFTIDDGATRFVDSVDRVPPFQKAGKEAVRCHVFRTAGAAEFVGYLERVSPAAIEKIAGLKPRPRAGDTFLRMQDLSVELLQEATEVKKPGDGDWVSRRTAMGSRIADVRVPAGASDDLQVVLPTQ